MERYRRMTGILFWTLEAFLFLDMLFFDFLHPDALFQYLAIVLCIVFLIGNPRKTGTWTATVLAFVPTLIADWFLVVRQDHQTLATGVFVFTQVALTLRLFWDGRRTGARILFYSLPLLVLVSIGWIVLGDTFNLLVGTTLLYFSLLLGNILHSLFQSSRFSFSFSVGLILFAMCDIVIGIQNGTEYLPIHEGSFLNWILHPGFPLAWTFYLPAQALIAWSAVFEKGGNFRDFEKPHTDIGI